MAANVLLLCLSTAACGTAADVCLLQENFRLAPVDISLAAEKAIDSGKLQVDASQAATQGANATASATPLGLQLLDAGLVWAVSWKVGAQFPSVFMLPMIVGYILCGIICGPYVGDILYPEVIDTDNPFSISSVISSATLAFIGFCAGSELHFPSLGLEKFKIICRIIASVGFFVIVCGMPVVYYGIEPLMPIFATEGVPCKIAAALVICVVEMAGSVIEVLAVYLETRAKGPMTELLLGMTMLGDMVVLTLFAIATSVAVKACPLPHAQAVSLEAAMASVLISIGLWLLGGLLLAALLQGYLMLPEVGLGFKPALILGTAFIIYESLMMLNDAIPEWSVNWGTINVDPLIICMISASIVNNFSDRREKLAEALQALTPWIMPAFFTFTGATLDLYVIAENAVAVPLLFSLRFVALACGTRLATQQLSLEPNISQHLWMTIQSQSGVTLGLLARLAQGQMAKQPWSEVVKAVITGGVCINQLVGPALCRYGIRSAGESHEEEDEGQGREEQTAEKGGSEEESGLRRTVTMVRRATSFLLLEQ